MGIDLYQLLHHKHYCEFYILKCLIVFVFVNGTPTFLIVINFVVSTTVGFRQRDAHAGMSLRGRPVEMRYFNQHYKFKTFVGV
jgi:hypothetical protein